MVADTLVYHPSVAQYLRYVATTVGRDKLLRAVQYFARFYAWYLLRTNGTPTQMAPWNALKRQLGLARKILRVGKPVEHLKAAAQAADSKSLPAFLRYTSAARQLGYAGYLTFDALALPDAMGVRKWQRAADFQRHAYRFWAAGIVFSLAAQLYTLRRLNRREAAINRKDGEGVVESKRINMSVPASPPLRISLTHHQGAIGQSPPARLRPLRSHRPHLGPRLGRLRRWLRRPGRHSQQLDRHARPVEKVGLSQVGHRRRLHALAVEVADEQLIPLFGFVYSLLSLPCTTGPMLVSV